MEKLQIEKKKLPRIRGQIKRKNTRCNTPGASILVNFGITCNYHVEYLILSTFYMNVMTFIKSIHDSDPHGLNVWISPLDPVFKMCWNIYVITGLQLDDVIVSFKQQTGTTFE